MERAIVLLDSENLFRPFRPRLPQKADRTDRRVEAAIVFFGDRPYEEVYDLGPEVVARFALWLKRQFDVRSGRSYGKVWDPGVQAVRAAVLAQDWVHVDVADGKDKADDAIIFDLQEFSLSPRTDAFVVGTSDRKVLQELILSAAVGAKTTVAVLGTSTIGPHHFAPGGDFEHVHVAVKLSEIYAAEVELERKRKSAADRRRRRRARQRAARAAAAAPASSEEPATESEWTAETLVAAVAEARDAGELREIAVSAERAIARSGSPDALELFRVLGQAAEERRSALAP